jgi:RNA polymerase sigma-70 factor (ECF subfamily)
LEDDSALVGAVQGGDLEAFSELFRRHYPDVQRACARRLACPLEAEEIAQAAFVRALERIEQCRGDRQFGGWVQIIARHLCVDSLRATARVVPSAAPMSENHADGNEPHDSLLDRERTDHVQRALASLPPRQRQAVTARALGSGPGQIADDLGLSVGAVDSLILRGRRRLALAYRRVAGEGGATATATSATAAASLLAAFSIGFTRLLGGVAAAAEAGRELVAPVASGVTGAIMSVAVAFTGSGPANAPDTAPPAPPPAAVASVPFPDQAGPFAGGADTDPATVASASVGAAQLQASSAGGPGTGPGTGTAPGSGPATAATSASGGPLLGVPTPAGPSTAPATPAATGPTPSPGTTLPLDLPLPEVVDPVVETVATTVPPVPDRTAVADDVGQTADEAVGDVADLLPG